MLLEMEVNDLHHWYNEAVKMHKTLNTPKDGK
jgi:hypothetical protein